MEPDTVLWQLVTVLWQLGTILWQLGTVLWQLGNVNVLWQLAPILAKNIEKLIFQEWVCLVWKMFPHPVRVFCTPLEPPNSHMEQFVFSSKSSISENFLINSSC